jgi:hypothetical protein
MSRNFVLWKYSESNAKGRVKKNLKVRFLQPNMRQNTVGPTPMSDFLKKKGGSRKLRLEWLNFY